MTRARLVRGGLSLALWLCWTVPLHAFHTWKKDTLPNGMTLLVVEKADVPAVSFTLLVKHGTVSEPADKRGIAALTARLLTAGTRRWSDQQIAERLAATGGVFVVDIGVDDTTIDWTVLKSDLVPALAALAEMIQHPLFPQTAVKQKRAAVQADLREKTENDPRTLLLHALFGDGPYGGWPSAGAQPLTPLTREDVVRFHRQTYRPDQVILAAVGDITATEFKTIAVKYFGAWSAAPEPVHTPLALSVNKTPTVIIVDSPLVQASLRVAFVGTSATDLDAFALELLAHVLADGPESRLGQALREQRGWTYAVRSNLESFKNTGMFVIAMSVPYELVLPALEQSARELLCLTTKPVTEAELARAKQQAATRFAFATENLPDLVHFIARYDALHTAQEPPERLLARLDRVTPAEIQQVARRYLHPQKAVVSIEGDRAALRKFAPNLAAGKMPQWATQCNGEGQ